MKHPDLQPVFSAHGQPEVAVMGTLTLGNREFAVSGRIDRMAVTEDSVVLLDYKTNRVPPREAAEISYAHRAQLAIYREILRPLYPAKRFDCVLVYTETAQIFTLDEATLSAALVDLKTK